MTKRRVDRFLRREVTQRRERPELIECYGQTSAHVEVHIGNDRYTFLEDRRGRLVAQINRDDHIECFLARPEMYRVAQGH